MKALVVGVFATVALILVLAGGQADGQEKPKYKIAEVMAKAMKGGLCKKVADGKATAAEKETLIELFTALHANTPPKGSAESWKGKTSALLDAAKAGDNAALKKAANCAACHKEHKGK
jgi:hypothetical protein